MFYLSLIILQGLGATVEPLKTTLNEMDCHPVSKTKFTMLVPDVESKLEALKSSKDVDTVILCGIETHVCVVATCIDLLHRGFNVSLMHLCPKSVIEHLTNSLVQHQILH